jgi:acyl transferase domain-containing protein
VWLPCPNGANDHIRADQAAPRLLLLSAADEGGCHRLAKSLHDHLHDKNDEHRDTLLDDMAYTLNTRRTKLQWKSFAVIQCLREVKNFEDVISKPVRRDDVVPNLAFVFTGQGAQWIGMGRELLDWPVFFESVQESQVCIKMLGCSWSLLGSFSYANPNTTKPF